VLAGVPSLLTCFFTTHKKGGFEPDVIRTHPHRWFSPGLISRLGEETRVNRRHQCSTEPAVRYRLPRSSSSLRANPFPEVTDLFCRLPLLALLYRLEVVNLGDLMRWWVRQGVKLFFTKLSSSKFSRSVSCAFNLEPIWIVWWEHRLALVALDPPLSVKDFRGANSACFCSLCGKTDSCEKNDTSTEMCE